VGAGRSGRAGQVEAALDAHPKARALYVQASETSTTALHPIQPIAALTRDRDTLLVVDGITAVGALDLSLDCLGIDALVTGSQKGLMLPPGLAFAALSERAWKACDTATLPRFYFDFKRERKGIAEKSTAWTPAISLIFGLRVALQMMRTEGWNNVYARHDRLARATRAGAAAIGLKLLAADAPSPAATAVFMPEGIDGSAIFKYLRDRMHVTFAGGQDQLKGKIIRVTHLGYVGSFDVVTGLAALELALTHFGAKVELGRGIAAAERILLEGLPAK
jgi:aspartate aminotransferase-like enzyme